MPTHYKTLGLLALLLALSACNSEQSPFSTAIDSSEDTTPNSFGFTNQQDVELSAEVESEAVNITGINTGASISIDYGEFSIDGGEYTSTSTIINNNSTLRVRHTSSDEYANTLNSIVRVGNISVGFSSTTIAAVAEPDTDPDDFSFTDKYDVALRSSVLSEEVTLRGFDSSLALSVEGGQYSRNGGAFTSAASSAQSGDRLRLLHTSSASNKGSVTTTVSVGAYQASFTSTTLAAVTDTTPNPFSFSNELGVDLGDVVESEEVTITGLGAAADLSVVGGEYSVNDSDYSSASTTINNGSRVRLRHTAPDVYDQTTTTTLTIDEVSAEFSSTTTSAPDDTEPNAFSFADQIDVETSSYVASEEVEITGISTEVGVSVVYGQYRIKPLGGSYGDYTSEAGVLSLGATLQLRHLSSSSYLFENTSTVSVGDYSTTFSTTTKPEPSDLSPEPFEFASVANTATGAWIESPNTITVEGIGAAVGISVSGAGDGHQYQVNGGDYTSATGEVEAGDLVRVRHLSSADYSTATNTSVTIGDASASFTSSTQAEPVEPDTSPDPFAFASVSGVALSSSQESELIEVSGIDTLVDIRVNNGFYSVDDGSYSSIAATIGNGQSVRLSHTSANTYSTEVKTTIYIGDASASFSSFTEASPGDDNVEAFTFEPITGALLNTPYTSNYVEIAGIGSEEVLKVSVDTGEYRTDLSADDSWTSVVGEVQAGDYLQLRQTSSGNYSTTTTMTVYVGDYDTTFEITTDSVPADTASGFVMDGPLYNARVFLDIDNDGEWDEDEPYTFTNEDGSYELDVPAGYLELYRLVAEITDQTTDTETGAIADPYSLVFYDPATQSALSGFLSTDFVLNPFTTMIQSEVEAGNAPLDAVELVATHLGLNPQYHFYLLADYVEVKATGEYLGEQLSEDDMEVVNRLHNIARTAVRVLGIKMTEVNEADPALSARGKALASQQVLSALKIKLRNVIDTDDDVGADGDGSDAEQELDLNAELYAANIDVAAILANVASIIDDEDSLKPGKPVALAPDYPLNLANLGNEKLEWNMYYGENGESVYLYDVAATEVVGNAQTLSADSPNAQGGEFYFSSEHFAREAVYQLQVCLENDSGISCSTSFSVSTVAEESFDEGVTMSLPLSPSGAADKRPQAPKWDGWMQNVSDGGYIRSADYYAPSWNKWSGALAETYEFFRCAEYVGLGDYENSICEQLNSDETAPEPISTWDRWEGGQVVGQAGGQTAKEIIQALTCYAQDEAGHESAPCYYLEAGEGKGMQYLHQVRLCNNDYADCSVSPLLALKVVQSDGQYDISYADDSGEAEQNQSGNGQAPDPEVPDNKDADPTIGDNGGGSVTDSETMAQGMDITAPSVQYVEGSWQAFAPGSTVTVGMVKYWGQAGDLWELWAEGPLEIVDDAVERNADLARQIASGAVSPMPDISETWSTSAEVSFADYGIYIISGAFCNADSNLADNPEACTKSSNTQTIEVAASSERTVVSVPAPDTGDDGGDSGSGDSGDTSDSTSFALLESEEYAQLESERRGDKLNEAITNIRTVGVDKHEVVDGEDDGPDLNTYSFANVERVQAIYVERYAVLEGKGLLYETASDADNQARIAWEWLFPMANGHIKQFPSAYNEDVANGKYPYTYTNYLKAVAKYPAFCGDAAADSSADLDELCMQAMASMFAHFAQEVGGHLGATNATYRAPVNDTLIDRSGDKETGNNDDGGPMKEFACSSNESGGWCGDYAQTIPEWRQALYWVNESGCSETGAGCLYRSCDPGTWQAEAWPCPADTKYFGRGPKQLSYNYNYGPYSYIIYGDVNPLLQNPAKVTEGWLAFASAVYFFMQPRPPKPSMFELIYGYWTAPAVNSATEVDSKEPGPSFGASIMIINGGIECGGSKATAQAANRVKYYNGFMDYFGLDPEMGITYDKEGVQTHKTASMSCMNMLAFEPSHGAAYPSYWEEDWSALGQCQLVTYETAFSGYLDGDYEKCVHNLLK